MAHTMDSERWQRIGSIFQSVLDCDPDRRGALLDSVCAGDAVLRQEIESLLASYQDSGFTERQGLPAAAEILERRSQHLTEGKQVRPYRILREIGQAGSRVVYLA